jgi:DNA topoisomerase-2
MTRALFPKDDDAILTYLEDDGDSIEPDFYLPIIPMILVNGADGIGMGYSTQVVCYSPENIIDYLEARLVGQECRVDTSSWVPYYEGFRGTITRMEGGGAKFLVRGIVEEIGEDKVRITELPIGMATSKMMSLLKTLVEPAKDSKTDKVTGPAVIKDYCENNTDTQVDIVVEFPKGGLAAHRANLDKLLKLTTTLTTANMYLFDSQCRLRKYERVDDILEEYYNVRLAAFERRRAHVIAMKERDLVLLSNRARYILETLEGQIDLRHKSGAEIVALLSGREFAQIEGDYEYLLKLRMDSVSKEKAAKIIEERDHVAAQLAALRATTGAQIWLGELRALRALYAAYRGARGGDAMGGEAVAEKKKTTSTLKKRATTSNTK